MKGIDREQLGTAAGAKVGRGCLCGAGDVGSEDALLRCPSNPGHTFGAQLSGIQELVKDINHTVAGKMVDLSGKGKRRKHRVRVLN